AGLNNVDNSAVVTALGVAAGLVAWLVHSVWGSMRAQALTDALRATEIATAQKRIAADQAEACAGVQKVFQGLPREMVDFFKRIDGYAQSFQLNKVPIWTPPRNVFWDMRNPNGRHTSALYTESETG